MKVATPFVLIVLCGASGGSPLAAQADSAKSFVDVVEKYCYAYRDKPGEIAAALGDAGVKQSEYLENTYEISVDRMDVSITPDRTVCTTDVLLKPEDVPLFTKDQLEPLLSARFKLLKADEDQTFLPSIEGKKVAVTKTRYVDESTRQYLLTYPTDHQDTFFMTFDVYWAK